MRFEQIPNTQKEPPEKQPPCPGWVLENGIWKDPTKEEHVELTKDEIDENIKDKNPDKKLSVLEKELEELNDKEYTSLDDKERKEKLEIEYTELDKQAKQAPKKEKNEKLSDTKVMVNKEKEELEKEITKRYYDQLGAIQKMPDDTGVLKKEKTEKYFQLIESWKNSAYLDSYKGINKIFSELDALKPSMFFYGPKRANTIDNVTITMASNYEKWDLEDKEKIKTIKNFIDRRLKEKNIWYKSNDKDCAIQEITKILTLKNIPFKGNLDILIKNIENPDIKSETISKMINIRKKSTQEKEQLLKDNEKKITKGELLFEPKIKELLNEIGVDASPEAMKFFEVISSLNENPDVQEKIQKVIDTEEFKQFHNLIEKITKEKKEMPESLQKVEKHIKDSGKESKTGTIFGTIGSSILLFLVLFLLAELKGVEILSGQAEGKKKK
jgi:hypothetical protein